jgi:hypothetical protein
MIFHFCSLDSMKREAITKLISEHGTSPFTREPLHLDELRPARWQHLSVALSARMKEVTLPPPSPQSVIDFPLADIQGSASSTRVPSEVHDVVIRDEYGCCGNAYSRKKWLIVVLGIVTAGVIVSVFFVVRSMRPSKQSTFVRCMHLE